MSTLEIIRGHPKVPSCGWSFAAHGQSFTGRDVDDVIAKLTQYRTQNSLPLGNPEHELATYYADMAPYLVRERQDQPIQTSGQRQRVAEHTMRVWYLKPKRALPHAPEVEERLGVCSGCPHSEYRFSEPESAYWRDAGTKAALMTGRMDCAERGFCTHHHWLLTLAARLVSPVDFATMPPPPGCWVTAS